MACDIHVIAETRTRDGEPWNAVTDEIFPGDAYDVLHGQPYTSEPFGWRSYAVFTFFAGVRHRDIADITPISQPRGMPYDASPETRKELRWYDYHSHSWLSLEELLTADYRVMVNFVGEQFDQHLNILKKLGDPHNVRIVFAFDS